MKYVDLFKKLNKHNIIVFSVKDIKRLFSEESPEAIKAQVHQWKGKGWIKVLRRGIYQVAYPEVKVVPDLFVANRLYEPSYVSMETVLSMYSIIPEVAMGVTSITTKPTRRFSSFVYHTVRPRAFIGYRLLKDHGFEIKIAEPEKALVDYIYFKLRKKEEISERLEREALKQLNRKKMEKYAGCYPGKIRGKLKDIYAKL